MSVRNTAYFREFLDFAYLWMRDNGKDISATYQPAPENQELWKALKDILPEKLFELCPMHMLGSLVDRASRTNRVDPLVLTVSLNSGRNSVAEPLEQQFGIYDEFEANGGVLIDRCANYFKTVGTNGGFWHKISRVSRQSLLGAGFDNPLTPTWMDRSVAHVDLWPLRLGKFAPFIKHHRQFPTGFQRPMRQQMLIELIRASDADLTLLLGEHADLGLPITPLPTPNVRLVDPSGRTIPEFEILRITGLPRCYRIRHPSSRGCLVQWDNMAERIRNDLIVE